MKQISTALVKAQRDFGPALKTSTNPHFRSTYADLATCVEAVIDALNANGIALIQRNHENEKGVTVETVFVHESGEVFECGKLHFPAIKQDPQGYASALTYARRYSLMAACGIAPEDDDGNAATHSFNKQPAQPLLEPMPEHEVATWIAYMQEAADLQELEKNFKTAFAETKKYGDQKAAYRIKEMAKSFKAKLGG